MVIADLKSTFTYDEDSGEIYRGNEVVGCPDPRGYKRVFRGGKYYYCHRLAWLLHYGEWPTKIIDHIDGDKSNNTISNLRDASYSTNNVNKSSAKGYYLHKKTGKWMVRFMGVYLGLYNCETSAMMAHRVAKSKYMAQDNA
tara:strand:+ start:956 stop:1378 length:423 start_codon:yes stop_codon:yes gene_type:complete